MVRSKILQYTCITASICEHTTEITTQNPFYVHKFRPTGATKSDAPWVSDGQDGGLVGPQLALVGVRVVVLSNLAILEGFHT
jgi:hypothetical protein